MRRRKKTWEEKKKGCWGPGPGPGAVSYCLLYNSKNYTQSLKCRISLLHDIRLTLTPVCPSLSFFVGFTEPLGIGGFSSQFSEDRKLEEYEQMDKGGIYLLTE